MVRVERGDCEDKGSGEKSRMSGGERGVLRVGMVSGVVSMVPIPPHLS